MALTLTLASLRSRTVATANKAKRAINRVPGVSEILKKLARFAGWLFGQVVQFFNLSFDRIWDVIVQGYFALKYFDWNATDAALQKQIESNNRQIVTAAASAIGTTLGWGTVRLANFFLGRFLGRKDQAQAIKVPVLSARIGLALAEEGNEEIVASVRQFLTRTTTAQISNAFINFVLTSRRNEWFGMQSITKPQSNGSIAQKIEDKIEKLPEFWRQPVEELIESFEEAIIEAGYVVSFTIDDYVAAQRYAQNNGVTRTIEVKPSKDSEESLIFKGNQPDVIQTINTTLYGTYPLIENRDVGVIAASPVHEQIKLEPQLRKLCIFYNEHEQAPFKRKGVHGVRAEISVPDCKSGLTYRDLKSACPKYTRGNWFVTCRLENGREMSGWFSTFREGQQTLTTLARLSTSDLVPESFRASEGVNPLQRKDIKIMHPVKAGLIYPRRNDGKRNSQQRVGSPQTMILWRDAGSKPFR